MVDERRIRARWSGLFICAWASVVLAADPLPYSVDLAKTPDSALNAMLRGTSDLANLRKSAPVGPFALIGRAQNDIPRLKTVLESFGYYEGRVSISIDSLPLDDVQLGEELANKPAKQEAKVHIAFEIGPLYHVGSVELTGDVPPDVATALKLSPGAPAVAAEVLAAGDRMRQALAEQGYAFAKVDAPHAKQNASQHILNISFRVAPGARYRLGPIQLRGLKTINASYVNRRLLIHSGEGYKASAIEAARRDLLGTGVFTQVSVAVAREPDTPGEVTLTFKFQERKPRTIGVSAAYSSDLGASAGVKWTKREITGNADSLTLSADVLNLGGGSATDGIGYDLNGKYLLPDWKLRDQTLQVDAGVLKQSLDAYDQKAALSGVSVIRKLSQVWSISAGFTAEQEQIIQEAPPDQADSVAVGCTMNVAPPRPGTTEPRCTYNYTLLGVPLNATFNTTGLDSPLEDAIHGVRASLTATPTFSIGHPSAQFLITQLTASTYFDLHDWGLGADAGRSVLAVRGLVGLAAGASQYDLPPDQRFYAGGSGTIRGYRYQSVGPEFPDGNPIGGTAIDAGTVEFRQRIGTSLGFAVFVDAGNVSTSVDPVSGALKVGVGAGLRYYTVLGPLRLDLAVPVQRRTGAGVVNPDESFQVYIGLGQAF